MKLLSLLIFLSGSLAFAQNHIEVSPERDQAQLIVEEMNQYGKLASFYDLLNIEETTEPQGKHMALENDVFVLSCTQTKNSENIPSTRCVFEINKDETSGSKFAMSSLKGNQFARVQVFGELALAIEQIIPANENKVHLAVFDVAPNFRFMITGHTGKAKSISMTEKKL